MSLVKSVVQVGALGLFLAATPLRVLSGQDPAEREFGRNLVGTDPYRGLPSFYAAYPEDYPTDGCRPARPTSHWHRWYYQSPTISAPYRDARLRVVERRVLDFEEESDLKKVLTSFQQARLGCRVALAAKHATSGKRSLEVKVERTEANRLPVVGFSLDGDAQLDFGDNFRWLKIDIFNPTERDLIVGLNKVPNLPQVGFGPSLLAGQTFSDSAGAQAGFGPTFIVKPGANTLACKTAELNGYHYLRTLGHPEVSRVYLFILAEEGTSLFLDNLRFQQEVGAVLSERGKLFDFGADDNYPPEVLRKNNQYGGVFPGWIGVSAETLYTRERGHGWEKAGKTLAHGLCGHRQDCGLITDFIARCDVRFFVELPNGKYGLWFFGNRALAKAEVLVQGEKVRLGGNGAFDPKLFGHDLDLIKGDSPWYRYAWPRGWADYFVTAEVTDGRLVFEPRMDARSEAHICALAIYPLADREEAEKEIGYLKTVTLSEALESGHGWIQPALMAAARYGSAHEEFLYPEKTPQRIRDLGITAEEMNRGYILFTRPFTEAIYFDSVPRRQEANVVARGLQATGCPGQFLPLTVGVYPLANLAGARILAGPLRSEDGRVIGEDAIDVRVERYDERWVDRCHENGSPYLRVPVYQVRRAAVALEKGLARRFVADLRVPANAKPGRYRGQLRFLVEGKAATDIPVVVDINPFRLAEPDVYFAAPAPYHALYTDYGFNVLKTDHATAREKRLKGYLLADTFRGKPETFLGKIDAALQQRVADGAAGKAPRLFFTADWVSQRGAHDPRNIDRLRQALPDLDIITINNPLFWLPDASGFHHKECQQRPTAANIQTAADKLSWLADGLQPCKELGGRFTFGLYLWRSGIRARISYADAWMPAILAPETHGNGIYPPGSGWVIDGTHGANMSPTAGSGWAFFLSAPDGQLCPSRDFVNLREGITDYRYLQTLEERLRQVKDRKGPAVETAQAFLRKLREEIDPDLTRSYGAWKDAHGSQGGGENWYPRPEFRLDAERLDALRAEISKHLVELASPK